MSKDSTYLLVLLGLVFVLNFMTMPFFLYNGDPMVMRTATANLVLRGTWEIPPGDTFDDPGKSFVMNKKTGRWYSKFGPMNSLMYLPPIILSLWLKDQFHLNFLDQVNFADTYVPLPLLPLNLYNIFLSLLLAYFLWKWTSLYHYSEGQRFLFIVLVLYGSFAWYYLRAQTGELFQLLFFAGFINHYLHFLREAKASKAAPARGNLHLMAAASFIGLLLLTRVIYGALVPIMFLGTIWTVKRKGGPWTWPILGMAIPMALFGPTLLYLNHLRFGSPWDFGYQHWVKEPDIFAGNILEGLKGFIFSPQKSIFIHFPWLIFSLWGAKRFHRKYPADLTLVVAIFGVFYFLYSKFVDWGGDWCYGPRYLLFVLPFLSMPMMELLEQGGLRRRKTVRAALLVTALLSLSMQLRVNSLNFFSYFYVKDSFDHYNLRDSPMTSFFEQRTFASIYGDFLEYREGRGVLCVMMERAGRTLPVKDFDKLKMIVDSTLEKKNYLWAGDDKEGLRLEDRCRDISSRRPGSRT